MANPYYFQSLRLEGFRAYLNPKNFDFTKKRCLAIFAPNGSGKSSFIDALEFMFSKEGTLERLGLRTFSNKAGPIALAHYLSEEAKITPTVTISLISGKEVTTGNRSATGTKRQIPEAATAINACFAVSPIIRGHALRTFVEVHTPEERYSDVANWLQLGPLVDVQKNIRSLRSLIKAAAQDNAALQQIDSLLAKETAQTVKTWDSKAVLTYVNESVLGLIDNKLVLRELAVTDLTYVEMVQCVEAEEKKIGLAGLKQIRSAAAALWAQTTNEKEVTSGAIHTFEAAVATLSDTKRRETEERSKAEGTVFQAVWKAAEALFADEVSTPDACPVCDTPITKTTAGSPSAIREHVTKHLDKLASYASAKKAYDNANTAATQAHTQLMALLPNLINLLDNSETPIKPNLITYHAGIANWSSEAAPNSHDVVASIADLMQKLARIITDIESKQGDHTYHKAKVKIDKLLDIKNEYTLASRTKDELVKLSDALTKQSATISTEIRIKVQSLLNKIQTPMNDIYKTIQGTNAKPIRLELPNEEETNQQRLNLVIDFAKNRTSVQPGGYLSDSQLHSVALAFRLAAIKQFNVNAPIIALDDIVTSYDADHRRTIAGMLGTMFGDCQIFLTTHDERFFNYLKDQLEAKTWQFTRIIGLDPSSGPKFADHKISDDLIEARWTEGQSAANEMRQAEEEWLLSICRDFGVSVRIRQLEKAYSYERSELASALGSFLKDSRLTPAQVSGVNNRFLESLAKGEIENFGSHFQDVPYGTPSLGDEKTRWEEFKAFRSQFSCKNCDRKKFQRPVSFKKPVCAHDGCETQFEFTKTGAT